MVIGIDAGGTKTAGRLAGNDGQTIAEHHSGPANMQVIGAGASAGVFLELIEVLCEKAGCQADDIDSIAIGLAGAGRPADRDAVLHALKKKYAFTKTRLVIVSDADITLEAVYGRQPGVVVIAGTGSIIYGRTVHNRITRMGGWGPLLGDPGSGTDIGIKALQRMSLIYDGRAEGSERFAAFAATLGIHSPETLVRKIYAENLQPSTLTRPVFEAASRGDANAVEVLRQAAGGLVTLLDACLTVFTGLPEIPVALQGGLLDSDTIYRRMVVQEMHTLAHPLALHSGRKKAIEGAVSLAHQTLHTT